MVTGELWVRGLGVVWSVSHGSFERRSEWGGSTPGPVDVIAGGAVGPHGLSPEATDRVTPVVAVGHRATGYFWAGFVGLGLVLVRALC